MKTLNFTATEVLPSLLNHKKVQTVRPAFCKDCVNPKLFNDLKFKSDRAYQEMIMSEHKPRFNVGDTITLYWHQRTSPKDAWFCQDCGNQIDKCSDFHSVWAECKSMVCTGWDGPIRKVKCFPKILGQGKITEVFKIEMFYVAGFPTLRVDGMPLNDEFMLDLAKKDGFKNVKDMWNWFDKRYDLDKIEHREFWVYRWEYI